MGVTGFGADFSFLLWEGNIEKYHYGLVNVAAFLANAMVSNDHRIHSDSGYH